MYLCYKGPESLKFVIHPMQAVLVITSTITHCVAIRYSNWYSGHMVSLSLSVELQMLAKYTLPRSKMPFLS